jgi:hypothetical protein
MDENYDDDQHMEVIRNRIFSRYDKTMRRLAEVERNESEWAMWCNGINKTYTHLGFDAWLCECGAEWIPILEVLFSYADEWNKTVPEYTDDRIRIDQVKEKYGGLRFYYSGGSPEFRGMVEMGEILSRVIKK